MNTRVLKVILSLPDGKNLTYSLADPVSNLAKTQVETLFNDMITESFILVNDVEPDKFKDAYIYETNKIALA